MGQVKFFDMEFIRNPPVQITIPKAQHCNEIKPQTPEDQLSVPFFCIHSVTSFLL